MVFINLGGDHHGQLSPVHESCSPSRHTARSFPVLLEDWSQIAPFLYEEIAYADQRGDAYRIEKIAQSMGTTELDLRERLLSVGFGEVKAYTSRPADRRRQPPSACKHLQASRWDLPQQIASIDDVQELLPRAPLPFSHGAKNGRPSPSIGSSPFASKNVHRAPQRTLRLSPSAVPIAKLASEHNQRLPTLPLSPTRGGVPSSTGWTDVKQQLAGGWLPCGSSGKGGGGGSSVASTIACGSSASSSTTFSRAPSTESSRLTSRAPSTVPSAGPSRVMSRRPSAELMSLVAAEAEREQHPPAPRTPQLPGTPQTLQRLGTPQTLQPLRTPQRVGTPQPPRSRMASPRQARQAAPSMSMLATALTLGQRRPQRSHLILGPPRSNVLPKLVDRAGPYYG